MRWTLAGAAHLLMTAQNKRAAITFIFQAPPAPALEGLHWIQRVSLNLLSQSCLGFKLDLEVVFAEKNFWL